MTQRAKTKSPRATISLSTVVNKWAEELAEKKGFDNFSAYIADLIRRDKEADEQKELRRQGIYPAGEPEIALAAESSAPYTIEPKPKKPKKDKEPPMGEVAN